MPETATVPTPGLSRPLLAVATALGVLLAGTVALWVHYGTAVFYEMIVAGIAACL
jgi:hypothetical protein